MNRLSRVLIGLTGFYLIAAIAYLGLTIPQSFRADYLAHLMKIVEWDHAGAYGNYLPFIFEFQSGHILALQKIYALANFYLFGMSALFAKIFGLATMLACWAVPVWLWARQGLRPAVALACLVWALLYFSFHGFEVYGWAEAISAHYPTAAFALLTLAAAYKADRDWTATKVPWKYLALASASLLLTVTSNGSGWAILPCLVVLILCLRGREMQDRLTFARWVALAILSVAFVAGWVISHANAGQNVGEFSSFRAIFAQPHIYLMHFLASVAGPWAHFRIEESWPMGIGTLALFIWLSLHCLRRGRANSLIWLALGLFGIIGCAMVSLSRFTMDVESGWVAYRYTIYALPIYAGLLGMALSVPPLTHRLWRAGGAGLVIAVTITFIFSSLHAHKREIYQNREVEAFTRSAPQWNMKSAFRMSSSYELPRLYRQTLPLLKEAGRARALTDPFIPAGATDGIVAPALSKVAQGDFRDISRTHICSTERTDARLGSLLWDDRYQPQIRAFGSKYLRLIGYARDVNNCDTGGLLILTIATDGKLLCAARAGRQIWDDLPDADRRDEILNTPYGFDFSCPVADENLFPFRVFGYNTDSQTLSLLGTFGAADVVADPNQP